MDSPQMQASITSLADEGAELTKEFRATRETPVVRRLSFILIFAK